MRNFVNFPLKLLSLAAKVDDQININHANKSNTNC